MCVSLSTNLHEWLPVRNHALSVGGLISLWHDDLNANQFLDLLVVSLGERVIRQYRMEVIQSLAVLSERILDVFQ